MALASAGDRLPTPSPGPRAAPPLAAAALRRGASAAGGWRLAGRRAGRALSSPGRSEAAATAAGGGFLRCCPSRCPRTAAARTPAPPPRPACRSPAASAPRAWPLGPPCPRVSWAHVALPTPSIFTPRFPNSTAPMMGVASASVEGSSGRKVAPRCGRRAQPRTTFFSLIPRLFSAHASLRDGFLRLEDGG